MIIGKEKALVIDTMNGIEDVKAVADAITSLPLTLINTHVHPDHIGGNHFFEEGDVFDLGGLYVEIYELPGHTPGQLCLLLAQKAKMGTSP